MSVLRRFAREKVGLRILEVTTASSQLCLLSLFVPRVVFVEGRMGPHVLWPGFPIACAPPTKGIILTITASALVLLEPLALDILLPVDTVTMGFVP